MIKKADLLARNKKLEREIRELTSSLATVRSQIDGHDSMIVGLNLGGMPPYVSGLNKNLMQQRALIVLILRHLDLRVKPVAKVEEHMELVHKDLYESPIPVVKLSDLF